MNEDKEEKSPSLRNLTVPKFGTLNSQQNQLLQRLVSHHIESFDYMLEEGLRYAVQDLRTYEVLGPQKQKVQFMIEDVSIGYPTLPDSNIFAKSVQLFPSECRQRAASYKAQLSVIYHFMVDGHQANSVSRIRGHVPIMVKSSRCRLHNMTPTELVKHQEEAEELGGYFIINGNERLIRMLIMPRRNYPLAIIRNSWAGKGPLFTEYGVTIRCVRKDQSQMNMTLHYLSNGSCTLAFARNKELFYIPVVFILKALLEITDIHIYNEIVRGNAEDNFMKGCVLAMLRSTQAEGVVTRGDALRFIGQRFRIKMELQPWTSNEAVTMQLLKEHVAVHLSKNSDKFNLLVFMVRKLYALADGRCSAESADSPMNQEILLGGHLYLMILKERLNDSLRSIRIELEKQCRLNSDKFDISNTPFLCKVLDRTNNNIGTSIESFLATGNLNSRSGLNLQQTAGFTIIAEKLNFYRYLSHFRAVHRGAFFAQMRTTAVRKLLPEAWGFLCPVHTPDGAPCGLLNHLAALCQVTTSSPNTIHLPKLLVSLGMTPLGSPISPSSSQPLLDVILDGKLVGVVTTGMAEQLAAKLRILKVTGREQVPSTLEIGLVPIRKNGQFPGLFLFSSPARMMRPVVNLATKSEELIGSFEQVYMNIAVVPEEIHEEATTHLEVHEGSILSTVASFTPFSDHNQSPRNMYQCQMGKQTMGFPAQSLVHRMDNKIYKLQTPQSPMVRPYLYDQYSVDDYPLGTNAVVAVISYTGYDMEDAMILNKASFERGFAHASVYKCELIDLAKKARDHRKTYQFGIIEGDKLVTDKLDSDGLPPVGALMSEGDPLYSYIEMASGKMIIERYKSQEPAYIDQVKLIGSENGTEPLQRVFIKLRINRNPIIGDKFASRHGQKGVCSQKWPVQNLPFTETGMVPDIIFNPHGFPSRMTIGMMIESMAGKSAAMHGLCHDATPFTFSEETPAVKHFGNLLLKAGYNYYGNERMYSGVDGRELEADIFFGVVYYQRLRHMVSDKFQVRTTGPIDILTHQPVKGRKRAGGIRFGEMERDSLLSHGSAFLLQDRLLNCSDQSYARLCRQCGSILSPVLGKPRPSQSALSHVQPEWQCRWCTEGSRLEVVSMPYVFRYLIAELAAMNIRVKIDTA